MKQQRNYTRMQVASEPYLQITLSGNTKPTDGNTSYETMLENVLYYYYFENLIRVNTSY